MPTDLATRTMLPGQTTADPGLVAEAVADINAAYDRGGLHTMRAIAAIVLDRMFRDDVTNFLQAADDHASYLALGAHPELRVSKSALWYAVAVEDNFRLLGDAGGRLSVSHHKRLVHVADPATRAALAGQAIDGQWTVVDLEQAIAALQPPRPADAPRIGRPPLAAPVKHFGKVQGAIERLDPAAVAQVEPDDAAALLARAEAAQAALGAWIGALRARVGG